MRASESLHIGYLGQPEGHGTQHHWRIFCDEPLQPRIEALLRGTAPAVVDPQPDVDPQPTKQASGNYNFEWGGLYLRSGPEVEIAKALNETGTLFFANSRGRCGLSHAPISNSQLSGRIEVDFLLIADGHCLVLEVDGLHHNDEDHTVRDYARDRALLKAGGISTIRFTAQDCLKRPAEVVSEALAILGAVKSISNRLSQEAAEAL